MKVKYVILFLCSFMGFSMMVLPKMFWRETSSTFGSPGEDGFNKIHKKLMILYNSKYKSMRVVLMYLLWVMYSVLSFKTLLSSVVLNTLGLQN